jgi:hypothetical protein
MLVDGCWAVGLTDVKEEEDEDDDVDVDVTEEDAEVEGVGDVDNDDPSVVVVDAGVAPVLVCEVDTVVVVAGVVAGEQSRIWASRATRSTSS